MRPKSRGVTSISTISPICAVGSHSRTSSSAICVASSSTDSTTVRIWYARISPVSRSTSMRMFCAEAP